MIDDFLTLPDDLPALRACRRSPRPVDETRAGDADAASGVDGREPGSATSVPPGAGLAAGVVLVVSMIALPPFSAGEPWSKAPSDSYRPL